MGEPEPVSGLQRLCPSAARGRLALSFPGQGALPRGRWGTCPARELVLGGAQDVLKVQRALMCGTSMGHLRATDNMEVLEHVSDSLQVTI